MKTSLTDIIRAERFLRGELSTEDRACFERRLLADSGLRKDVFFHRIVHRLVLLCHRRKLRAEIDAVHQRLFHDPSRSTFRESVLELFNP